MSVGVSIELQGISRSFDGVQAVFPLSLAIPAGEMLALLGPSGCGKTTTLRMVAGFEAPDTGAVLFGDRDVTAVPPNHRKLGTVFQNYGLFPHMSVGQNVAFGLRMQGVSRADRTKRAREMLATVRLAGLEHRMPSQLSGGQQQRVALARALVTNPSVLLLDEPLGALDRNLREGMQFELRELQRALGITAILVTHDQEEALTMANTVTVMKAGRVLQIGAPAAVYARPQTRFVAEFLGTANVFDTKRDGSALCLSVPSPAPIMITPESAFETCDAVAIRPEAIEFTESGAGLLQGKVLDCIFRGAYSAFEIQVAGRDAPVIVYSQVANSASARAGTTIGLRWPHEAMIPLRADA